MYLKSHRSKFATVRRPSRSRPWLWAETLESRELLSIAYPMAFPYVGPDAAPMASTSPPGTAKTPAQIRTAYGFDNITLRDGIQGDGSGQTIAIVDAYDHPNIFDDVAAFDSQFGLPGTTAVDVQTFLTQAYASGSQPSGDVGWGQEIALDVEWAHAIAPGANILLVEAASNSYSDLLTAVDYAAQQPGLSVVSMSWGGGEFSSERDYDFHFSVPGVTFVGSSGDSGLYRPEWPSVSPNVVSVGGTTLNTASDGSYLSETAWNWNGSLSNPRGSTGGVSTYELAPYFQAQAISASRRQVPDISYVANPSTGVAVYDSYGSQNGENWYQFGGTSVGAPQWAALFAIVNQGRSLNGIGPLNSTGGDQYPASQDVQTNLLYGLAYTEYPPDAPSLDFHDTTNGYNVQISYFGRWAFVSYNYAVQGYDAVTGLGSPQANHLVPYGAGVPSDASFHASSAVTVQGTSSGAVSPHALSPIAGSAVVAPQGMLVPVPVTFSMPSSSIMALAAPDAPSVTLAVVSPFTPNVGVRPVQPLTNQSASGNHASLLLEEAGDEVQAPALTPVFDPADSSWVKPWAPVEAAPAVPLALLQSWDDGIAVYVGEGDEPVRPLAPLAQPPAVVDEQPASALEASLMAGVAVALWGSWEVRSRSLERRLRRSFLRLGGL